MERIADLGNQLASETEVLVRELIRVIVAVQVNAMASGVRHVHQEVPDCFRGMARERDIL
jgi:hypothetical protein